jgi:hypothetical protein
MNPQWEAFWKQDLERRAAEALAPIERYRCLMDSYKAKADGYTAIAERAGFTSDHPLVKQMCAMAEEMKLDIPHIELPKFDISGPLPPKLPSPSFPEPASEL